ncbi:ribosomal protection-like ABC-F family protein [Actinoalloteichus hoggarensis]
MTPAARTGRVFQLALRDAVRAPGGRTLLDGVTVSVAAGERAGVIGENGSGKSTLLRLIAGLDRPDGGEVTVTAPGGVGYLGQVPDLPPSDTVQDAIDHALADLRELEHRMRTAEQDLTDAPPEELPERLVDYGNLVEAFELRDGYAADARVDAAMDGLGLVHIDRDRLLGSLSGGEQSRLGLACLLAASPELLLLDEPTNHLDVGALTWLEDRLRTHRGTVVVVSHDRVFLERVTTVLLAVDADRRVVERHGGGYQGYLRDKQAERDRWEQAHRDWLAEISRQTTLASSAANVLAAGPRRDAEKSPQRHQRSVEKQISARVRQARERLRRLHESPVERPPQPLRFRATLRGGEADGSRSALLHADQVSVGDRLDVASFAVGGGERVLITGPNGAGKSTLLRVLAGDLQPDQGRVRRPRRLGWLPQDVPIGDPDRTLAEAFAAGLPGPSTEHRGGLTASGLFRAGELDTPVGRLSIGQRRRLLLARLFRREVDVLLLDEPTNHLSPALVEQLEEALAEYAGAVVIVSHDRMLRSRFTGRIVTMQAGRLVG